MFSGYTCVILTWKTGVEACWGDLTRFGILWRNVNSLIEISFDLKASLQVRELSVKYSTSQHIVGFVVLAHSGDFSPHFYSLCSASSCPEISNNKRWESDINTARQNSPEGLQMFAF